MFKSIFILSFLFLASCNRLFVDHSQITIKLPPKVMSGVKTQANSSENWNSTALNTIQEADCYALYLKDNSETTNTCVSSNGNIIEQFSKMYGLYKQGELITLEIPKQNNVTFGIIAFKGNATCESIEDLKFNSLNYSVPKIVGKTTTNLVSGTNIIDIPISLIGAEDFETCSGSSFSSYYNSQFPLRKSDYYTINEVKYSGNTIDIIGSGLTAISEVSLVDNVTGVTTSVSILSKIGSLLKLTPIASNFLIKANNTYSLLIKNAKAQSVTYNFTLNLADNTVPVSAIGVSGATSGQVVTFDSATGKAAWKTPVPGGGSNVLPKLYDNTTLIGTILSSDSLNGCYYVLTSNNTILCYWPINGIWTLRQSVFEVSNSTTISLESLTKFHLLKSVGFIYFSGINCTGQAAVVMSTNDHVAGSGIITWNDMNGNYTYKLQNPANESSFAFQSFTQSGVVCSNSVSTLTSSDGNITTYSLTGLSAGDPSATLSNVSFQ